MGKSSLDEPVISEVVRIRCKATDSDHEYHEYPRDWIFGGPQDDDAAADPRWKPTNYTYWGADLHPITVRHHFKCDEEAIDFFTVVAEQYPSATPTRISARRPDGSKEVMLPVTYDKAEDMVTDVG